MTAIIDGEIITELSGFKSRKTGDSFAAAGRGGGSGGSHIL